MDLNGLTGMLPDNLKSNVEGFQDLAQQHPEALQKAREAVENHFKERGEPMPAHEDVEKMAVDRFHQDNPQ